jgi:iron complex transport system substrate-binding protein
MKSAFTFALTFFLCIASSARADVSVLDDSGQVVHLRRPAQRIVTLAPHATELLFAIGAGNRIVGTMEYSNFPEEAKRIPRIGGYRGLDMEAIAALHPDVIIAWPSGNTLAQVEKLKKLGLTLYLSEPKKITDIASTLEHFGVLTGNAPTAQQAATQFRRKLEALRNKYQGRSKVRVFYQVWDQPLMTINGEQLISDALRQCGGENIFAQLPLLTPTVSVEALLQANPDVIIGSDSGNRRPQWLDDWKKWPRLQAVKHDHLYFISADWISQPTPRMLQGMEAVCELLEKVRQGKE